MNSKKTSVTVEDLIRIKKAERPPAEYWARFEREMHLRQLAAIVEPRPWWAPFIRVGARISHYQLPISAAAILAVSIVTIREYQATTYGPTFVPEVRSGLDAGVTAAPETARPVVALQTPIPSVEQIPEKVPASLSASASDLAVGDVPHSVPLLDSQPIATEPTPSARYIAANLAAAQAADPRIVDEVFGSVVHGVESRESIRDPLTQVATPGEARRSRFLGTALPASVNVSDVAVGTSDRVARRLSEERLYDSISRVGLKGDRVAIKF